MVSTATFVAIAVVMILTLLGPLVAALVYSIRNKGKGIWKAWFLGAAGFFLLQVVIRISILNVLAMFPWFQRFAENQYVLYCFLLALTAALFEVVARFGVAKILQKDINCEQGVAAGLGHGGIEAMVLIGMTYVSNLLYAVMINTGAFDGLVEQTVALAGAADAELLTAQLSQIKAALVETPAYTFYLAGYERILCVLFHTAMSLLVCYTVYKKKAVAGVGIALTAHFCVDFVSPIISGLATSYLGNVISTEVSYVIIYGFLTAVGVGSVVLIRQICKKWKSEEGCPEEGNSEGE